MENKRISIVTPNYNYAQYIGDTIESIVNQDYDNIEHVIVDDGSTDNSVEIIKSYQAKYPGKIKLICQENQGQSRAINTGLKAATGDIIGWINSDDLYTPNTFKLVAESLSDSKVDAIYSNYHRVNAKGEIVENHISQNSKKWMSLFYCFIPSNTFFFKRKILDNDIYIDNNFQITMDKEFFAHIYYSGYKIQKVNAFLAHFRWHDSNKSIDSKEIKIIRLKEGIEVFNRYSGLTLAHNLWHEAFYKIVGKLIGFIRTVSRKFQIGIYRIKKI